MGMETISGFIDVFVQVTFSKMYRCNLNVLNYCRIAQRSINPEQRYYLDNYTFGRLH